MPTFVALLRGVNVGNARRVPMVELRDLLSGMGYAGVATLLNSGNAVFRAARGAPSRHAADIAAAISADMGVDVPVIVKSASEFAAIIEENPLAAVGADNSRLLVAYTQDPGALKHLASIGSLVQPPEQFVVGRNAAYLYCAQGILASKAGEVLLGKAGKAATTRNWATTLKLGALAARDEVQTNEETT
jgi:uncharacterized protein (DUF1697 family)